jgi:hypothetical protein
MGSNKDCHRFKTLYNSGKCGSHSWRLFCIAGDATVTIAHRYTPREQLKAHTQLADIIIVAAGKSALMVIWWGDMAESFLP